MNIFSSSNQNIYQCFLTSFHKKKKNKAKTFSHFYSQHFLRRCTKWLRYYCFYYLHNVQHKTLSFFVFHRPTTQQSISTESPDPYQTTRTNYNYHPIMEYFVSPQTSSPPEVRERHEIVQRKADPVAPSHEFQTTNSGWYPMSDEFGPRNLKWFFPYWALIYLFFVICLYKYLLIFFFYN